MIKKLGKKKSKKEIREEQYKFRLQEKVLYCGSAYSQYTGLECEVISRTKDGWFRVRFFDGKEILTPAGTLREIERKEEINDSN